MLGGVEPGDQLLNVEGISLLGISVQQAHEELNKAMSRSSVGCVLPIALDTPSFVPCVVIYIVAKKNMNWKSSNSRYRDTIKSYGNSSIFLLL